MAKQEGIVAEGTVLEALPDTKFRVELENGHIVLCHLSGKLRQNFIKILPRDRVRIEMSIYDLTRARIIYREPTSGYSAPVHE